MRQRSYGILLMHPDKYRNPKINHDQVTLLTDTHRGVPGPDPRHTAVSFVSMELVARTTAKDHQQSSVTEKRLPILQVSKTAASLRSTRCETFSQ